MFFKNLTFFRLTDVEAVDRAISDACPIAADLGDVLAARAFVPAGKSDRYAVGWVPPTIHTDRLAYRTSPDAPELIALKIEEKLLPGSVVTDATDKRVAEIERNEMRVVGRKELREIRERVAEELLPRAFSRFTVVRALLDWHSFRIVVDTASPAKAELLVQYLRETIGTLPARLPQTEQDPVSAMTTWLEHGAPEGFTLDADASMKAPGEGGAQVTCKHHDLNAEEVRKHLENGKLVTKLAMTLDDRVAFVLTDKLQIKRVQMLDLVQDQIKDANAEGAAELYDASLIIMVAELRALLDGVTDALGGELQA